ncbi:MAG TPA: DUF2459 domain-containing protein [Gammaproteobacteria bacterium]|nr:DUF2459 domain-containing protein [Gammaproteobacteria bacterium]
MPPGAASAGHSPGPGRARASIGVLREGWHTGLVLPAGELDPPLAGLRKAFPRARYLAFGWGDRAYYTKGHPGFGTALSALFPSASVLFVRALPARPADALPKDASLHWLCVLPAQVRRLDRYIGHYLRRGPHGRPRLVGRGGWPRSRFYASAGRYDALHTCNTWTAAALEYAGLPVHAGGVAFAGQVLSRTRSLAGAPTSRSAVPGRPADRCASGHG